MNVERASRELTAAVEGEMPGTERKKFVLMNADVARSRRSM
jgi:hypothetical protein